jgi:hypothetical protein
VTLNEKCGATLLSVGKLCDDTGNTFSFTTAGCFMFDTKELAGLINDGKLKVQKVAHRFKTTGEVGDLYRFDKKMLKSDFKEFDGINFASAKNSKDENNDFKISANKISEKSDLENVDAKVSENLSYLGSRDVKTSNDAFNWHLRTGHMGISTLEQMKANGWIDYNAKHLKDLPSLSCRGCLRSVNHKHVHKRRDAAVRNATRPLQRNQIIHAKKVPI